MDPWFQNSGKQIVVDDEFQCFPRRPIDQIWTLELSKCVFEARNLALLDLLCACTSYALIGRSLGEAFNLIALNFFSFAGQASS